MTYLKSYLDAQVRHIAHDLLVIELILDIDCTLYGFPHNGHSIVHLVLEDNLFLGFFGSRTNTAIIVSESRPHDNHSIAHEFNDVSTVLSESFNHAFHVTIYAKGKLLIASNSHKGTGF
jgi:hypothetical protein